MQHSVRSLPVIFEIDNGSGGVNRVRCVGDYHEVLRGMKLLRRVSLQQNAAMPQLSEKRQAERQEG